MTRLVVRLLPLSLTLLLAACSGGSGSDGAPAATGGNPTGSPVALSVQWPASLTGGAVHSASIRLPSRVQSLSMVVDVLAPDFAGQRHTVEVAREGGSEVTRVDGEIQPPEVNGLDLQVPVGTPRRFRVTATAEVVDAAGQLSTLNFTGFLDLTVTGDGDGGVVVMHEGDGAADGVPQVASVELTDGAPGPLRVDSAAVDLGVTATFDDNFTALEPPAAWTSDDSGVAQVDDTGLLRPAGKGSATLTVTVGGVPLHLPVTVENTPPRDLTTTDQLPPAGDGEAAGIGDQTVAEDASLTLEVAANDPDGDPLAFTATSGAVEVAAAVAGNRLTLTPAANFFGAATITVTADDGDGGSTSDTFTLTVTPVNDPPRLEAVAPQTIPQGATLAPLSASDVEGDPLTFQVTGGSLPPGLTLAADGSFGGTAAFTAAGPFTATVTVADGHGGTDTATVAVTVLDQTPPAFGALPPVTVEATGPTTPVVLGPVTAADLVNGAVAASADPAGPFGVGNYTITWTATDGSGNTAQAQQQLTVEDTTPPAFGALAPITVEATGPTTPVPLGPVTATDGVDGAVAASADPAGPFGVGNYTITWTAVDGSGNTAQAQQQLTVEDTAPPAFGALAPITVEATGPTTPVVLGPVTATDGVDGAVAASADQAGPFGVGNHTITWTAADASGNTAQAQQQLTVQDTTPPKVTLLFPMGGIVGQTTTVGVVASDLATDVAAVTVTGPTNPKGPVDLVQGADPTQWRVEGLDVALLGTPLTVVATDGAGNPARKAIGIQVGGAGPVGGGPAELVGSVDLAAEPEGDLVLADRGSSSVLRVVPVTGTRSVVTDGGDGGLVPFATPVTLTVRDSGEIVVVAVDSDTGVQALIAVDAASGGRRLIGDATVPPTAGTWFDVAVGTHGDLLVLDRFECSQVLSVDPLTGVQVGVAAPNPPCFPVAVAEDGSSILLVEDTTPALYRVDAAGATVFSGSDFSIEGVVGNGPVLTKPQDLAVAPDGGIWVVDDDATGLPALFRVDPRTGDPTTGERTRVSGWDRTEALVGTGPSFSSLRAVAVDPFGRVYLLGDDGVVAGVWQIDPITGDRALISASMLPLK